VSLKLCEGETAPPDCLSAHLTKTHRVLQGRTEYTKVTVGQGNASLN